MYKFKRIREVTAVHISGYNLECSFKAKENHTELENYASRMTGNLKEYLKKQIFIEKSNKAAI
jgi:hypothetical protein